MFILNKVSSEMTVSELKNEYVQETGIKKEDCILMTRKKREIMEDSKTLRDYNVGTYKRHVFILETKSSWLMHFIYATWLHPGLISHNMTEDLMKMYKGEN